MDLNDLKKLIAPIKNKIMNVIGRAVISAIQDDKKCQTLQINILKNEIKDDVERFSEYGFTSKPIEGAEAIAIFVGGNRDHGIVIATEDRRYRPSGVLSEGEVALYTDEGIFVHLKKNKILEFPIEKLKIENSSHEFVSLMIELIDTLLEQVTNTAIGPQPLVPTGAKTLPGIKTKFETFKV